MDLRRSIPSVERLLSSPEFAALLRAWPRPMITDLLREHIALIRAAAERGESRDTSAATLANAVNAALERLSAASLVPAINATGVILHTNLGRAPLASAAVAAVQRIAGGYSNLEYDLDSGSRGSRYTHCRSLLQRLTGAADALIVNNNAAALVLALNTLSRQQEAIVSRGELVEIGGAFRVPEIMERSGARLRDVGSTNRTHPDDYRAALSSITGALLKVHPSNFTIEGYTAEVSIRELAPIAREADVPLIHDVGSGLLLDPAALGLDADEPTPRTSLEHGADIVTMSGDKLLGGPQCGIILGNAHMIERMRRNPLCRALRVDKMTIAALEATLRLYLEPARARAEIPVLRMLTAAPEQLRERARSIAAACSESGLSAELQEGMSAVGGGASPGAELRTTLVLLRHPQIGAGELETRLRAGPPVVVARVFDDRVALDPRTVSPDEEAFLIDALRRAGR